ncbi:hypothetical protein [Alkalinema sp. FACHB-956]|uniref:hypothetical protein n=1 Tax=Alkalinema sp. FACHB-956 TaxID=2692768 RepID=UPI001682E96B|nr:hypothetical protein [Alkalinema sp. FACHB-956]MBD2329535.1 hypothetical protein [Alkalinema sp. FACHB-956]
MQLQLLDDRLEIHLTGWERLWAFHFSTPITIPLSHITQASTEPPASSWKELRAPGSFLPGVIKAGTYYTPRGREFWYVTRSTDYLTLELTVEPFQRIVLNVDRSVPWADRINHQRARLQS